MRLVFAQQAVFLHLTNLKNGNFPSRSENFFSAKFSTKFLDELKIVRIAPLVFTTTEILGFSFWIEAKEKFSSFDSLLNNFLLKFSTSFSRRSRQLDKNSSRTPRFSNRSTTFVRTSSSLKIEAPFSSNDKRIRCSTFSFRQNRNFSTRNFEICSSWKIEWFFRRRKPTSKNAAKRRIDEKCKAETIDKTRPLIERSFSKSIESTRNGTITITVTKKSSSIRFQKRRFNTTIWKIFLRSTVRIENRSRSKFVSHPEFIGKTKSHSITIDRFNSRIGKATFSNFPNEKSIEQLEFDSNRVIAARHSGHMTHFFNSLWSRYRRCKLKPRWIARRRKRFSALQKRCSSDEGHSRRSAEERRNFLDRKHFVVATRKWTLLKTTRPT